MKKVVAEVKSVKVNGVAATVDTAKGTWELTAAALADGVNNLNLWWKMWRAMLMKMLRRLPYLRGYYTGFPCQWWSGFCGAADGGLG